MTIINYIESDPSSLASIQALTLLILFLNTTISCLLEIDGMNAIIIACKSSSKCRQSQYTADFAAPHR